MIFRRFSIASLGLISLQIIIARANSFELATDVQTCIELCDNCGGTAGFEDNICQCHVVDDDQKGAECIGRIKRRAEELGLDVVSCDLASTEADRTARCIFSPLRRFKNRDDGDLIAKYFMENPLGELGSLLSSKLGNKKDASDSETEEVASTNGDKREVNADSADSNSQIVGAANPVTTTQYVDYSPLLGLAPTWLQARPLMVLGPELSGTKNYPRSESFVGSRNPQTNFEQMNYVGSPQPKSWDFYSNYPPGSMLGLSPYSYFAGAPNPVRYEDVNQRSSYLYGYNPPLVDSNYMAPSSYPYSPVEASDPQLGEPVPPPEGSLDESPKTNEELVEKSDDLDPNLGSDRDAVVEDGAANSLESIKEENEEDFVPNSKRTADDTKTVANPDADTVAAPLEKGSEKVLSRSKSKMKRRQSKLKSKASLKE